MKASDARTSNLIHDPIAETYGYDIDADTASRMKYDLVASEIRPTDRVLDVGCANGIHLTRHRGQCRSLVGVDLNDRMLALAARATEGRPRVDLSKQDASHLAFRSGVFDLVYSFSTLVLVPDLDAAVADIARVLRPGGTAILDLTGRYNVSQVVWRRWYRRRGHRTLNALSRRGVMDLLIRFGLEIEAWHGSGFADQWKYLPVIRKSARLQQLFHGGAGPDLDYRISNRRLLLPLANRWFVIAHKRAA